jgi:hypothetical protein
MSMAHQPWSASASRGLLTNMVVAVDGRKRGGRLLAATCMRMRPRGQRRMTWMESK